MVLLQELVDYSNTLLDINLYRDYCPNGLQVQGKQQVSTLVSGVTASQDFLQGAIQAGADALLVHHGYFWKGEDPCVVGMKRKRLGLLLQHDISLLAYHLPLDAHRELGNNAQLSRLLGLQTTGSFAGGSGADIGLYGRLPQAHSGEALAEKISQALGREPMHIPGGPGQINTVAWCSGGAQGYIEQAVQLGVDAYISGEISEQTVHIAREQGIHYFACGHHATERYGVQALGEHLAQHFGIKHLYLELDNPV